MRMPFAGIALALLLCSCSDEFGPFKAELAASVEEVRGNQPPPLPAPLQPTQQARYEAARLPDPFYPERR